MLETVREYARERLREAGEETAAFENHAKYFCDLAEAAAPYLPSASREFWLRHLEAEVANLREALAWTSKDGDVCVGLRLVGALGWFWVLKGYVREGAMWTRAHLSEPRGDCTPAVRIDALYTAAAMAWKAEDFTLARQYAEMSLSIGRGIGDSKKTAFTLALTGLIAISQGEMDDAIRCQQESVALFRDIGERWGIAYGLSNLGDVLLQAGNDLSARVCYEESLDLFTELGDPWGQGLVLNTWGSLAWKEGDVSGSLAFYEQSVILFRELGNRENAARGLIALAAATLTLGDAQKAATMLRESLRTWRDFGNKAGEATCLRGLASVEVKEGRLMEGVRLFAKADAASKDMKVFMLDSGLFSPYLAQARNQLGREAFDEAWAEGSMSA
jgi:tetratricopeptide (TPR) repeat protein